MDIEERFYKFEDEYLNFEEVENKLSTRPDLHAFIMLNEIFPGTTDIVSGAEHDEIFLSVDEDEAESLTDDQIRDLVRCGVRFNEYGMFMFV